MKTPKDNSLSWSCHINYQLRKQILPNGIIFGNIVVDVTEIHYWRSTYVKVVDFLMACDLENICAKAER
jgi:hypothetical protein